MPAEVSAGFLLPFNDFNRYLITDNFAKTQLTYSNDIP